MRIARVVVLAFVSGCPSPYEGIEDTGTYPDIGATTYDVVGDAVLPTTGPGDGRPSCDATAVIDLAATGVRSGREVRVLIDTRGRANLLHPRCAMADGPEAVVRYRTPPGVNAVRVSTDSPLTEYDTVISARPECNPSQRDYTCNDDDPSAAPRSTLWMTDLLPGDVMFVVLDGSHGQRGVAELVFTEVQEGSVDTPCRPPPRDRPGALRDPSRCDVPSSGRVACEPSAGPDGTDMCLHVLSPGQPCDPRGHANVCDPSSRCAEDPMPGGPPPTCALPGTAAGAPCRPDAPQCDTGLGCSTAAGMPGEGGCVREIPAGGDCDPSRMLNVCAPGSVCRVLDADAGLERCVPP